VCVCVYAIIGRWST